MKTIFKLFIIACEAALLVLSLVLLAYPETGTTPVKVVWNALWIITGVAFWHQMRQFGVLGMALKQTYETAGSRPMPRLLTLVSFAACLCAMVAPTIRGF